MSQPAERVVTILPGGKKSAQAVVTRASANELVFAVVGHVGSGTTVVADQLVSLLKDKAAIGDPYEVFPIKATEMITRWAQKNDKSLPTMSVGKKDLKYVEKYQDLGDAMRRETDDFAAVAKALAVEIRNSRARAQSVQAESGKAVVPDGMRRAYVLDSIRHPAEVQLLRHIYQDAFVLIGVVCETGIRNRRLSEKFPEAGMLQIAAFMDRDDKAAEKSGQRVGDAFHLADYFLDNTPERQVEGIPNPAWDVPDQLSRLVKIIRQREVVRPRSAESAMWHAHGASMASACMSRQVGAALLDRQGNVVATGTNEVPRAGGGVYGEGFVRPDATDHRCINRSVNGQPPYCSNTREQNEIIKSLVDLAEGTRPLSVQERQELETKFRSSRVGDLLEFSRAVHAEMDALLSAARKGITTLGTRLFVTTFPCHYCARHIVSAGVDEVQYIEPYPKSHALKLHSDSVQITSEKWVLPSSERVATLLPDSGKRDSEESRKVLFRPFTGVAPRLYRRAFLKEAELKNSRTGERAYESPDWGTPWHLRKLSYAELEAELEASV